MQLGPRARREQWIEGNLPLLRLRGPATAGARCYAGSSSQPARTHRACAAHSHGGEQGAGPGRVRRRHGLHKGTQRGRREKRVNAHVEWDNEPRARPCALGPSRTALLNGARSSRSERPRRTDRRRQDWDVSVTDRRAREVRTRRAQAEASGPEGRTGGDKTGTSLSLTGARAKCARGALKPKRAAPKDGPAATRLGRLCH